MASLGDGIPKSTMALAGVLWAILAVLGTVILSTVLSVREDQREYAANQINDRRRLETLETNDIRKNDRDSRQDERIGVLEGKVK